MSFRMFTSAGGQESAEGREVPASQFLWMPVFRYHPANRFVAMAFLGGMRNVMNISGTTIYERATGEGTGGAFDLTEYTFHPNFAGLPLLQYAQASAACYVLEGLLAFTLGTRTITAALAAASRAGPSSHSGKHGRLSAIVVMRHSDDDVALLVALVDIPMRLGGLFQRIAPIDDRCYLSRLNELFEEDQTFGLLA
jgi:hypothetical protein